MSTLLRVWTHIERKHHFLEFVLYATALYLPDGSLSSVRIALVFELQNVLRHLTMGWVAQSSLMVLGLIFPLDMVLAVFMMCEYSSFWAWVRCPCMMERWYMSTLSMKVVYASWIVDGITFRNDSCFMMKSRFCAFVMMLLVFISKFSFLWMVVPRYL